MCCLSIFVLTGDSCFFAPAPYVTDDGCDVPPYHHHHLHHYIVSGHHHPPTTSLPPPPSLPSSSPLLSSSSRPPSYSPHDDAVARRLSSQLPQQQPDVCSCPCRRSPTVTSYPVSVMMTSPVHPSAPDCDDDDDVDDHATGSDIIVRQCACAVGRRAIVVHRPPTYTRYPTNMTPTTAFPVPVPTDECNEKMTSVETHR